VRWIWTFVVGLFLLGFQMGVVSVLRPLGGGPDFLLLFVIFLSLYGPMDDAPIAGWLLGFAKDCLSVGTLGLYAVLYMAISFFLSRIRADIFLEYNVSHAFNAAVSTFVVYLGASLWHSLDGAPLGAMVLTSAGVALWNGVLAPLVFRLFFKFGRVLNTSRRPG